MDKLLNLSTLAYIFVGGGVGSVLRFVLSYYTQKWVSLGSFPLGTFLVNCLGCLLIGYLAAFYIREQSIWKFFFITGFCGGFTTFSTFSLENYNLWVQGEYKVLTIYVVLSLLVGVCSVVLGFFWERS